MTLVASGGGPTTTVGELPSRTRRFTRSLDGFDTAEPIRIAHTSRGIAYKTDEWLFGPCAAVEAAYRTFQDPTYGDRCY